MSMGLPYFGNFLLQTLNSSHQLSRTALSFDRSNSTVLRWRPVPGGNRVKFWVTCHFFHDGVYGVFLRCRSLGAAPARAGAGHLASHLANHHCFVHACMFASPPLLSRSQDDVTDPWSVW